MHVPEGDDAEVVGEGEFRSSSRIVQTTVWFRSSASPRGILTHQIGQDLIAEGDIVVRRGPRPGEVRGRLDGPRSRGMAIGAASMLWTRGIVPFEIDAGIYFPDAIRHAMSAWEARTPVRFRERVQGDGNFAVFQPGLGDSSSIGMVGGPQLVEIEQNASVFTIAHEIGHLIGLWHEQSRHDRDTYVRIEYQNISPGCESQFDQRLYDGVDIGTYDYDSLMHYPRNAFSTHPSIDTIIPLHGTGIGQRDHISEGDARAVHLLYAGA